MYDVNGLVTRGPVTILGVTFQEWVVLDRDLKSPFLLSQLYGYAVMLIGGGVLGQYLHRNRGDLYTGQATALAVGIGTPLVVNFLLFAGIIPPGVGATSIAFAVTGIAFAIAIFRYRLLRVAPLGRQQLVDRMADAVVMLDDERRVVDCNLAARGLVDAPARWRGMAATEFFAPFPEQVEEVAGQASVPTEISIEDDGQTRHFELNRSPIEDGENIATGQLIVLRNVTEQRERERQLQRQNERLDQFASTVAHDLRNPLHVAQGYLELVQGESESEHLASIKNAHERMEALTNDLLTLARAGQTVENPALIGLANVAGAAWTHTDLANCEFTPGVPAGTKLEADRDRLLQVFENLYRNAADHNDTPVTVRVGMLGDREPSTDGGQRRGFFVEDTGDGILDEQREEIFEHGYTTSADGSGFGLSIVWDIVKAHGWDIRVTAGSDGGARFEITGVGFTENSAEITHLISER
ncbi:MAG: histidine kinase N-terminal 7TM domain-containing protein [Halobacteriota archaeon]